MILNPFHRIMLRAILLTAILLLNVIPASAQETLRIDLNIPALKLLVYSGDEVLESYPVAVGMPGFDTPTGQFAITHAEWNPWWTPPQNREWAKNDVKTPPGPNNPMGRVKLFFMPLYFFHGTPEDGSIGTPASHGCVRMLNRDVIALAKLLHEHAAPQLSQAELDRLAARPGATRRVNFQHSIPVTIRYDAVEVKGSEIFVYPDFYKYNALHTESVYQALLMAGYDVSNVDPADVRNLVESARGQKAPLVKTLDEVFNGRVALAGD